ncbi:hypothetical protein ACWPOB_16160 [Rhodococcus sp. 2H158]
MTGNDGSGPDGTHRQVFPEAGAHVGGGRYRLVERHGTVGGLQCWRGRDTAMNRTVALTLVPRPAPDAGFFPELCVRTASAAFDRVGAAARVFDVVDDTDHCVVVAAWTRGRSLRDVAGDRPDPAAAARMTLRLAETVRAAHRQSTVLCLDDTVRVRVGECGTAVLAFPAILPGAGEATDVAGLGAVLRCLLGGGERPGPRPLGTLADDAVDGRVCTAIDFVERLVRMLPRDDVPIRGAEHGAEAVRDVTPSPVSDRLAVDRPSETASRGVGVVSASAAMVLVACLAAVGWVAGTAVSGPGGDTAVTAPTLPAVAVAAPPVGARAASSGVPLVPLSVRAQSRDATSDNAVTADLAADANPNTAWSTDLYPRQVPAGRSGVGLTIAFARPVRLSEVRIDSLSAGSRVEIRTAPRGGGPHHASQTIGGAVLVSGVTRIPVAATAAPMSEVLVWITELAAAGPDRFRTSLSELGFSGDTGP